MNWYNNESYKDWAGIDTRTLQMKKLYKDWYDFIEQSGIEDVQIYRDVWEYLYNVYALSYTIHNVRQVFTNTLRAKIEHRCTNLEKANKMWDNEIEKLWGDYEEIKNFSIGQLDALDVENTGGYDTKMNARATHQKQQDILDKIKQITAMKSPFERVADQLAKELFLEVQPGYDEIEKGGYYGR